MTFGKHNAKVRAMTTGTTKSVPRIADLDGVKIGNTETARVTEAVLRSLLEQGIIVQAGLAAIATRTLSDEWTVYRWLRGLREPASPKVRAALQAYAAELGVTLAA